MAGETIITVVANLTADPELRTTGKGASVASFTIASTPRNWNRDSNQFEDGQALFLRCTAWRDMAEHCARSLAKGMRVIAQGRLSQHSWEDENHNKRTSIEMQVEEIGPSLRYATAQVTRTSSPNTNRQGTQTGGYTGGGPFNTGQPQGAQISGPADPWSQPQDGGATFGTFDSTGRTDGGEPDF